MCVGGCTWFICIVRRNWARLTWKSAIEIKSLLFLWRNKRLLTGRRCGRCLIAVVGPVVGHVVQRLGSKGIVVTAGQPANGSLQHRQTSTTGTRPERSGVDARRQTIVALLPPLMVVGLAGRLATGEDVRQGQHRLTPELHICLVSPTSAYALKSPEVGHVLEVAADASLAGDRHGCCGVLVERKENNIA